MKQARRDNLRLSRRACPRQLHPRGREQSRVTLLEFWDIVPDTLPAQQTPLASLQWVAWTDTPCLKLGNIPAMCLPGRPLLKVRARNSLYGRLSSQWSRNELE